MLQRRLSSCPPFFLHWTFRRSGGTREAFDLKAVTKEAMQQTKEAMQSTKEAFTAEARLGV